MDKNHILEILKDNSIDDENLANALSEIFTHLAHDRDFSEEVGDQYMNKLALDNATRLM
ncbi:hypothetical protein MKR37_02795 [Staphylococcus haemolyticus]|uniref:hypothetical protein n=1 Tax=Staphylococcus TaxID=1279 RepID=UPI001304C0FB|nr:MULTISPECIES: hypothetical protein [Staphylococcus]MBI5971998.1 hypothetical protein [Staphylococcus caledonicus]MCH4482644.1 hypothetical protein [Staphylococcus haemolyticus]